MIISHEHRFIFVKTRKTAGTSVEVALEPLAGPDGVVTPLLPAPAGQSERHDRNWRGRIGPLPDMRERWERTGRVRDVRAVVGPVLKDIRRRRRFHEHMSYALARQRAGRRVDRYFSFCFERNPWDKAVSWWAWFHRGQPGLRFPEDFEAWLLDPQLEGLFSEWYMYTRRGTIAVDFVGRFERLQADLVHALAEIGAPSPEDIAGALTQEKTSDRPSGAPLSDRCHERIAEMFHREIDAFGYTPPPELVGARSA